MSIKKLILVMSLLAFTSCVAVGPRCTYTQDGTKIESDIIVGADGVWSTTAKKTGLIKSKRNVSISLCAELSMKKEKMDEFFTPKRNGHMHLKLFGISGYGWVFPKKNHVNIGIGEINLENDKTKNKINLKLIIEKYIKLLKESELIPNDLNVNKIYGAAIPNYPLDKTFSDRLPEPRG